MCVHNYKSLSKTEINLRKGTRVFVIEKNLNGWWFVDSPTEGQGYVPKCVLKSIRNVRKTSVRSMDEDEEANNNDDAPIPTDKSTLESYFFFLN